VLLAAVGLHFVLSARRAGAEAASRAANRWRRSPTGGSGAFGATMFRVVGAVFVLVGIAVVVRG
jgi:hypothetical protein